MDIFFFNRKTRSEKAQNDSVEARIMEHKKRLRTEINKIQNQIRTYSRQKSQLPQAKGDNDLPDTREGDGRRLGRFDSRIAILGSFKTFLENQLDILEDAQLVTIIGEIAKSGTEIFKELGFNSEQLNSAFSNLSIASQQLKEQVEQSLEEGLDFMIGQTNDLNILEQSEQSVAIVEDMEPDAEVTEVSNKHSESKLTPE